MTAGRPTFLPPRLLWLGDSAVTLEFPNPDPERLLAFSAALDAAIAAGVFPGAIETLPALRSVTLYFDPLRADPDGWLPALTLLADQPPGIETPSHQVTIPVCFDEDFAPDLESLARANGLSRQVFIAQFLASKVRVQMLGFLPGFAYLGDLPAQCRGPRRATPRPLVPAGSLAIAGAQCAVYPWDSPGGWNLIGRTPIRLFDDTNPDRPSLLAPGDQVSWRRIDRAAFDGGPALS